MLYHSIALTICNHSYEQLQHQRGDDRFRLLALSITEAAIHWRSAACQVRNGMVWYNISFRVAKYHSLLSSNPKLCIIYKYFLLKNPKYSLFLRLQEFWKEVMEAHVFNRSLDERKDSMLTDILTSAVDKGRLGFQFI